MFFTLFYRANLFDLGRYCSFAFNCYVLIGYYSTPFLNLIIVSQALFHTTFLASGH